MAEIGTPGNPLLMDVTSLRTSVVVDGPDLALVLDDGVRRVILDGEGELAELRLRRLADEAMQLVALLAIRSGSSRPFDRTDEDEAEPDRSGPPMNAAGL